MAGSSSASLVFNDAVTADRSRRTNSEVVYSKVDLLFAQILLKAQCFTVQMVRKHPRFRDFN